MSAPAAVPPGPKYCDLVMKGGITSGVVYPHAITELAKVFRLKSVGGTSAGAIAAAAAAAAESGRGRDAGADCFAEVGKLPGLLSAKNSSGHTNLFTFFQPQEATSRLFRVLSAALNASKTAGALRIVKAAMAEYWMAFTVGALPGVFLLLLALTHPVSALSIASLLTGLVVATVGGGAAVVIAFLREIGRAVPQNFFGLCSGMEGNVATARTKSPKDNDASMKSSGGAIPLTRWLTDFLNDAAGLSKQTEPLTFGQLWNPKLPVGQQPAEDDCEVRLEMMTSCLTWGRPFRLPFRSDEDLKENIFYFRESEFRRLFPDNVVAWLCAHGRESTLRQQWRLEGFRPMPDPWNLPVVVATRMSLSFPVLLSAIPLYAYDKRDDRDAAPPRRCWFSDGGICSNFPMHFFDSPVPRWPTLGFNLVPDNAIPDDAANPGLKLSRGWMPESNREFLPEIRNEFSSGDGLSGVFRFVGAIIGTMQNWSDNTLGRMPGYRDRIAHVPLNSNEGGLNLNMPDQLILKLGDRGRETGAQFVERFAREAHPVMNWKNHRWLRLRSALASLSDTIKRLEVSCAHPPSAGPAYEDWLRETDLKTVPSYEFVNQNQRQLALATLHELRAIAARLQEAEEPLETKAPRPRPELRPRPRI